MEIIVGKRQSGKTTRLIRKAANFNGYLVVHNERMASDVAQIAAKMGIGINYPLTHAEFLKQNYHGCGVKHFYIDDAELLLERISLVPIKGITMRTNEMVDFTMIDKEKPMKKLYFKDQPKTKTHVAIVLDRSGSMATIYNETLTGFNEQVETIRKNIQEGDEYKVTLVTFDDTIKEVYFNAPIDTLRKLTKEDYVTGAMTALYDAVGHTIDRVEDVVDADTAILLIIVTDGYENASRKVDSKHLAEKIQSLTKGGKFTITYLGPNNVDLTKISKTLNIPMGNMTFYNLDSVGTQKAWDNMRGQTMTYMANRREGAMSVDDFYGDTKQEEEKSDKTN